jgi:glucose/arabinose dehydrogenase/cytochrome c551/c552
MLTSTIASMSNPTQFSGRISKVKWLLIIPFIFSVLLILSCNKRSGKPRVLVFSKTSGWVHTSIPNGIAAIQRLGAQNNFLVDTTKDASYFNEDSLKNYAAVIFLSTTEDVLNSDQQVAFERYIQSGGGFAGIHSAADTEYDWRWYGRLVGGYFFDHPGINDTFKNVQEGVFNVVDQNNNSTKGLPAQWKRTDEFYSFKRLVNDTRVLITLDENSYHGGKRMGTHPMAWYHEYDGGRAFYTALGHTEESYTDPLFLKHLLGGIQYAIGNNSKLNYSKAKSQAIPEENRFVKTTLSQGRFYEPTEMAILPNFDILVTQRRGEILRYSDKTKDVKQVGFLNVYYQTNTKGVNAEEGVLGITLDPDFKTNNFVYIYYSPIDTSVNRLSRFEFKNDTIDLRSEKVVLQLYSQREICCHTGGSLAFGADRTLFLSTGDNSTPFDEPNARYVNHGFAPLNDVPGHQQYDARRTSGNTNDLRGKVLRIKVNPDGSYSIPQGNLFQNDPKARPEIYVMGNRNPYRISVDKKTGFLYWGEVGPDSNVDSFETRGSRGYDEVNQAKKAGYFGWPLFVGNNFPYREFDYATGKIGDAFEPARPINRSRNNTGLEQLPPAQPAFIWYPYAPSKDFPGAGTGGRNAMAGPVYYVDDFPKKTRYPDYFNGKLIIYEWMRDWMKVVTMLPNGDFDKMDPFMEHTKNKAAIDMEVGPDGRIYLLEYGKGWFSKNPDAGISRIDYMSGNRPPKVDSLVVDKESGTLPLTISAKVSAKDPENDALSYVWKVGNNRVETKEPSLNYTFKQAGEYVVSVEVRDDEKASSKSTEVTVVAGNEQPQVDINVQGNKSFYFPSKPVQYQVNVVDRGDSVNRNNLFIGADFLQGNEDLAAEGHQIVPPEIMGKNIMMSSDCKSCHKVNEKSIGPSFTQVAQRRKNELRPNNYIVDVILKGSSGKWGENVMPAHATMKEGDAKQIAEFILSLAGNNAQRKSLPPAGIVTPKSQVGQKQNMYFAINASYTDLGGGGVRPLTGTKRVILRSNVIDAGQIKTMTGFTSKDSAGNKYLVLPAKEGSLKVNGVDLTGVKSIVLSGGSTGANANYTVEIRANGTTGNVIGQGKLTVANNRPVSLSIPIQQVGNGSMQDIYVWVRPNGPVSGNVLLKTVRFNP